MLEGCWVRVVLLLAPMGASSKAVKRWPRLRPIGPSADSVWSPIWLRQDAVNAQPPTSTLTGHQEGAHHPRSSPGLPHQPLQRVVGPQAAPVFRWHVVVAQRLADAVLDDLRGLGQSHNAQLSQYLESLFLSAVGSRFLEASLALSHCFMD